MIENNEEMIDKVIEVLQWIVEIDSGEMIESHNSQRTFMRFSDNISDKDLTKICRIVNTTLTEMKHHRRIFWNMGEIIPGRAS